MAPGRGVRRRHNSLEEEGEGGSVGGEGGSFDSSVAAVASGEAWALRRTAARGLLLVACGLALVVTLHQEALPLSAAGGIGAGVGGPFTSPTETAAAGRIRRRQPPVAYQAQSLHAPSPKQAKWWGNRQLDGSSSSPPGYDQLTDPSWWWGWLPPWPGAPTTTASGTLAPTRASTASPTAFPTPSPTTKAQLMLDYSEWVHEHGVTKKDGEYPGGRDSLWLAGEAGSVGLDQPAIN